MEAGHHSVAGTLSSCRWLCVGCRRPTHHPPSPTRLPQLLRRWRSAAAAAAPSFNPVELNQLHIVEVALRLEAPGIGGLCVDIMAVGYRACNSQSSSDSWPALPPRQTRTGLDLPREAAGFFDGLYRTGRLRGLSGGAWQRTLVDGPRSVTQFQLQASTACVCLQPTCSVPSLFHQEERLGVGRRRRQGMPKLGPTLTNHFARWRQVYEAMRALGVECQLEFSPVGEYSIDIALPQHRIAGGCRPGSCRPPGSATAWFGCRWAGMRH